MRKFLTIFLPVLAVVVVFAGFAVGCKKQSDVTPPKDTQKEVLTEDEQKAKIYSFSTYGEGYKIVKVKAYKLDANLILPSTYRGKPVVALEEGLFAGHDEIESVVIPDSVTSIGRMIFMYCHEIKFVKLSNNLTVIPDRAFSGCHSLVSVDMGNGVIQINSNAFAGCGNLETVKMSQNLESIGEWAFSSCRSLVSIVIPNGVTTIGESAFYDCDNLVEVWNLSELQIEAESSNYGGVARRALAVYVDETEKSRVTKDSNGFLLYSDAEKGEYVLVGYKGTEKNITLPENIAGQNYVIRQYAFYANENIQSVVIPNSVTSIGGYAFYDCYNLVEVWNLSSLDIVAGSWDYGEVAEFALAVYTDASVPSKVTKDANGFLSYVDAEKGDYVLVGYEGTDTDIELPDNIAGQNYKIRDYAFCDNHNITSVSIPEAVIRIGKRAFYNCGNLYVLNIPTNLTYVGEMAFTNCNFTCTTVCFGSEIEFIGRDAFHHSNQLNVIFIFDGNVDWTNLTIEDDPLPGRENVVVVKGTDKTTIETALTKLANLYYKSQYTIQIDATLVDLIPNTYGFAAIEPIQ